MPKKILLFAAKAATLVQFTHDERRAMELDGYEIHFLADWKQGNLSQKVAEQFEITHNHIHIHEISMTDRVFPTVNRHVTAELETIFQEIQPDILHVYGTTAGYYGRKVAKEMGIPVIYTACDFRIYKGCTIFERAYFSVMEKSLAKSTDKILTLCKEDADYMQKHFGSEKVLYLENASLAFQKPNSVVQDPSAVRSSFGIPEDAVVVTAVGALRMQKRYQVLVRAIGRLGRKDVHCVICGEGSERLFLEQLISRLHLTQQVHLVGYRTDIADILGASDIFALPARRETEAVAMKEAMSAGLPLVLRASHGTRSFRDSDGAICLRKDLVESCTSALTMLLDNKLKRKQMGAVNRADVGKNPTETHRFAMKKLYEECCK